MSASCGFRYAVFFMAFVLLQASGAWAASSDVAIVVGEDGGAFEEQVATMLEGRVEKYCGADVVVLRSRQKGAELCIHLCRADIGASGPHLPKGIEIVLVGEPEPAPEGFALKTFAEGGGGMGVVVLGADKRGLLYGVGELLRRMRFEADGVVLEEVNVAQVPAFRYRGSSASQGATMMKVTGAKLWTTEQWQEYVLDLVFSGANCFYAADGGFDFVKTLDMMTIAHCRPNELPEFPKAWRGTEMGPWVCPSVPEAHDALMVRWEKIFKAEQNHDILRFYAGDPGGCRCERCAPWGKKFIELSEEITAIWFKYHPDSVTMLANQDVTNAGDQAIFDYLCEKPRPWLYALAYGPGSNATSRYFRSEQREDLFVYPGFGPINRYLAETLNQLPKEQRIVHYSDITHWISAQYMVENPDTYVEAFYGRRIFHTRPRAFYKIFQQIMAFSEGDIIYSEGYHDEFHQYLWNRLLWDPNRSLDDVVLEYCRLHFGVASAEAMKEATYQLEENLEAPLATNEGIARYYDLVKAAGESMPAHLMKANHRWRLHMQKAALDRYIQDKLRIALDQEARVKVRLAAAISSGDLDEGIVDAQAILSEPHETDAMKELRDEIERLKSAKEVK